MRHPRGAVGPRNAADQDLAGIRGRDPAGLFVAVEGERIGADVLAPERVLEPLRELRGAAFELARAFGKSQSVGAPRRELFCGVDVTLYLGERDRSFGEPPVGVEHGVEGILPALVAQSARRRLEVFDKAVVIAVAGTVDPCERAVDRGPQIAQGVEIAGRLRVAAGQHDEQRRRVDAAVIKPERNLAKRSHFAGAHLVQDFTGLGVGLRVEIGRLMGREPLEDAERDARIEPEALQGGDEAVAAERRRIPGDAGVRVGPFGRIGQQDREIRGRPAQHLVEHLVRRADLGADPDHPLELAMRAAQASQEGRGLALAAVAGDGAVERNRLAGLEVELKRGERR